MRAICKWFVVPGISLIFSFLLPLGFAQVIPAAPRILQPVDDTQLTVLPGNVYPLAQAQYDRGAAPANLPMNRMLLVLQRSPEQETALKQLLDDQQDKASPQYHKWLTPVQFGQQFGPADQDIQTVTSWLQSEGFQVTQVSKGRTVIEFSGTAAQVQQAFHTSIHSYLVNGEAHYANASNPAIPAALAPVVAGVFTLHNFYKKPQITGRQRMPATFTGAPSPHVTFSDPTIHALGPQDYAAIYNINPAYSAGINGRGVIIGVVGRSDFILEDVFDFQRAFGLPYTYPQIVSDGPTPSDLGGGEEAEAVLDTTWSGAIAQGASVKVVLSASTNTTDGVDLSELYIVDNNLADVMTESFGSCEAAFTNTEAAGVASLAEEAAAQGITYMVSSGDAGAEGCDSPAEATAGGPVSANLLAATPFNVAVGGTMFNEGTQASKYWGSAPPLNETAYSYIPENVWNESCAVSTCGSQDANLAAGGGGASVFFSKPSWQSGVTGIPNDGARDLPDVSLTAAFHDPYLLCIEDSCSQGYIYFVSGTSASAPSFAGIMALVDQKAGGRQGQANYILYRLAATETLSQCNGSKTTSLPAASCVFNDVTVGNNAVPGEAGYGTGSGQYQSGTGYDLATGLGSVNVANLVNSWGSVSFNPTATTLGLSPTTSITHGTAVNVTVSVAPSSGSGVPTGDVTLQTSTGARADSFPLSGGSIAAATDLLPGGTYSVTAHYGGDQTYAPSDSAPVNITIFPEPSETTLSVLTLQSGSNENFVPFTAGTYGSFIYLRADVVSHSGQGVPTGGVSFLDGTNVLIGSPLNSEGNAATPQGYDYLVPGPHSISAEYSGDGSFNASTSSVANVTITQASTTLAVTSSSSNVANGASVTLTAVTATQSYGSPPGGTVTFFSGSTQLGSSMLSGGVNTTNGTAQATASVTTTQLPSGQDSITAQYSGDTNYTGSTSGAITVNVQPDFSFAAGSNSVTVSAGQSGTVMMTVTGQTGYNGTINFGVSSCAGLPSKSGCGFNPASITGNGSTTLTVTTTAPQTAMVMPHHRLAYLASMLSLSGALLAGVFLVGEPRRRRWSTVLGLVVVGFLLILPGCGGGSAGGGSGGGTIPGTPKGAYTITVTATSGSLTHTASFQLIVQ